MGNLSRPSFSLSCLVETEAAHPLDSIIDSIGSFGGTCSEYRIICRPMPQGSQRPHRGKDNEMMSVWREGVMRHALHESWVVFGEAGGG